MKYDITPDDLKVMAFDLANDRTLKYIRNLSFYKFTVGDVLVREEKYRSQSSVNGFEWKTKLADCGIANKYVYVFENELGVGYIRRLSVNGRKFVDRPMCVTEFDPDRTRFTLDPEYADHMILSDENTEFDAKSRYDEVKKKREQIHRKNKKLRIQLDTASQVVAWLQTLKPGDKFWWGYTIGSIHKDPYYVHEVKIKVPVEHSLLMAGSNPLSVSMHGTHGSSGWAMSMSQLLRYNIFSSKPTFVDEVID